MMVNKLLTHVLAKQDSKGDSVNGSTPIDYGKVQGSLTRKTFQYAKEYGVSRKEAWATAEAEDAALLGLTVEELKAGMGAWRKACLANKGAKAGVPAAPKPKGRPRKDATPTVVLNPVPLPAPTPAPKATTDKPLSLTDVYRSWCANNDTLPSDKVLAHFSDRTPGTFASARHALKQEGWGFEGTEEGWKVSERPPFLSISAEHIEEAKEMVAQAERIKLWLKRIGQAV